jgi:hypothetical protein
MSSSTNRLPRHALAEFSQAIGKDVLNVRLYKERAGFLCEREWVESDGSAFTQALPFHSSAAIREFLSNDPHYEVIKKHAIRLIQSLPMEIRHEFT